MTPLEKLKELEAKFNEYRTRILAQSGDAAYLKATMAEIMKDAGYDYRQIALDLSKQSEDRAKITLEAIKAKHTYIEVFNDGFAAYLFIYSQAFRVCDETDIVGAEWYADQLAKALERIIK